MQKHQTEIDRREHLGAACKTMVDRGFLTEIVDAIKDNIFRQFDSHLATDMEQMVALKNKLEGLKSIKRTIEDIAAGKQKFF